MFVDAAVVGLAGHRGVGDGHPAGSRQPGAAGIRGHQHRTQRRLAQQPSPFVEAQQHFRPAVDPGQPVGVDEVGRRAPGSPVDGDPIDLDRGVPRAQPAVGDEARPACRAPPARRTAPPSAVPASPSMARCTRIGRAERDVSGSRSLRTTTYEMPWRARVSARPAEGRPAANRRCTESSARMVCGGVSGIESRTPHGLPPSTCSGSSWLVPHTWVANGAPGTTSTRPGVGVTRVVLGEPVGGVMPVPRVSR